MLSKEYNLLYIHIPKTGGTSVTEYMLKLNCGTSVSEYMSMLKGGKLTNHKDLFYNIPCQYEKYPWLDTLTHMPFALYEELGFVNTLELREYITFSVVRNPIDRLKSSYTFAWHKSKFPLHHLLPVIVEDIKAIKSEKHQPTKLARGFVMNQCEFIRGADNITIIKLENINEEFAEFVEKFKLPFKRIEQLNKSPIQVSKRDFLNGLISGQSKADVQFVFDYYQEDCDRFNYNFDQDL